MTMNQNEYSFDLRVFLEVLNKRLAWLLIVTAFVGALSGVFTAFFIEKTYSSTVQFYVNSTADRDSAQISQTELNAAKSLVTTCQVIIKSDSFLKSVSSYSGVDMTPAQIRRSLTQSSVSNTEILQVKVSNTDPQIAYRLANAITELAPSRFASIVKAGELSPFDYAQVDTKADSPNIPRVVIISMLLTFLVLYAAFLFVQHLDTTIRREEDIKKICEYPYLGEIPRISTETGDKEKSKSAEKEA